MKSLRLLPLFCLLSLSLACASNRTRIVERSRETSETTYYVPASDEFEVSYLTPRSEGGSRMRSQTGKAYLDFEPGTSEIQPNYRNNASVLQRIYDQIRAIQDNPDARIIGITFIGRTSPEGEFSANMVLSGERAMAVKNYLRDRHGLSEGLFTVAEGGEDWAALDSMIANSHLKSKSAILSIIRGTDVYDEREYEMSKMPDMLYRQIAAEYYPRLRCVEYRIDYTMAAYSAKKAKDVYADSPASLSQEELFSIANTYEPGSDAYNEVFETTARLYPNSDVANVNAAASALTNGDMRAAARYLDRVTESSSAYWNNMGVLAIMQGDVERAYDYFQHGGVLGASNAAKLLQ